MGEIQDWEKPEQGLAMDHVRDEDRGHHYLPKFYITSEHPSWQKVLRYNPEALYSTYRHQNMPLMWLMGNDKCL